MTEKEGLIGQSTEDGKGNFKVPVYHINKTAMEHSARKEAGASSLSQYPLPPGLEEFMKRLANGAQNQEPQDDESIFQRPELASEEYIKLPFRNPEYIGSVITSGIIGYIAKLAQKYDKILRTDNIYKHLVLNSKYFSKSPFGDQQTSVFRYNESLEPEEIQRLFVENRARKEEELLTKGPRNDNYAYQEPPSRDDLNQYDMKVIRERMLELTGNEVLGGGLEGLIGDNFVAVKLEGQDLFLPIDNKEYVKKYLIRVK